MQRIPVCAGCLAFLVRPAFFPHLILYLSIVALLFILGQILKFNISKTPNDLRIWASVDPMWGIMRLMWLVTRFCIDTLILLCVTSFHIHHSNSVIASVF